MSVIDDHLDKSRLEDHVRKSVIGAMAQFTRYLYYFRQWFYLYADPLSDEIVSDIQEQAHRYAYERIGYARVPRTRLT